MLMNGLHITDYRVLHFRIALMNDCHMLKIFSKLTFLFIIFLIIVDLRNIFNMCRSSVDAIDDTIRTRQWEIRFARNAMEMPIFEIF